MNTVSKLPNPECEISVEDIDAIIEKLRRKPKEEEVKEVKEEKIEKIEKEEEKKIIKSEDNLIQNPYERRL